MEAISSLLGFIGGLIKLAIFLAIVLGGVALWGYNTLRRLSEGVKAAWSNTGVISARLAGEVNQMIEIASSVQNSEKFTFLKMSEDMSVAAMAAVQNQSSTMMANLSQLAQRYPELQSNRQFTVAQESVRNCQRDLAQVRQSYNDSARAYNQTRTSIPHVFYSAMLGFKEAPYLDHQAMKAGDAADRPLVINDDGERINALLRSGSAAAADAGRQLGAQAKNLLDKSKAMAAAGLPPASPLAQTGQASQPAEPAPIALPAQEHEYLYLDAKMEPQGPVTASGLAALCQAGVISPETRVFHPVQQRWTEYRELGG